ncbi:DUF4199 domain-containing protein [Chitinophaga sp. GCM10012297]|uniref:DUF4199 domain-containing protein n=1 Tax=Chitinophaga chungangae TaxID=2821488 RepID=A0ABS3YC59_9BACT|nr:DUF4199 domain-containing protein [Chitinophaga chungangae]MBO9152268.1 DUF4199 domain-containing protein [Chitinophaga chungangae]
MKNYQTELKWAGIHFLVYLAWMFTEHVCGLHGRHIQYQQLVSAFILLPSLLIYVLALREKKMKVFRGTITFRQAFKSGMLLTLFMVLLSPLSQLITTGLISPEYFENMREFAVSRRQMSAQEAESRLNTGAFIVQSVVGGLITGAVFSVIVSLFIRSRKVSVVSS